MRLPLRRGHRRAGLSLTRRPREGPRDERGWCADLVGEALGDALWPHFDVAERRRLVRAYGYPKDNALPDHIASRLCDPRFCGDVRQSLLDDEETPELLDALDALIQAAPSR